MTVTTEPSPTSTLGRPSCPPPDEDTQLHGLARRLVETTRLLVLAEDRANAEWKRAELADSEACVLRTELARAQDRIRDLERRLGAAQAPTQPLPVLPPVEPPAPPLERRRHRRRRP